MIWGSFDSSTLHPQVSVNEWVDESQDDTGLRENNGKEEAAIRPKSLCLVLKQVYTKKCKMDKRIKVIPGFRSKDSFTTHERHQIIREFLKSRYSKREIWERYTGHVEEHGNLLKWMRQLGYIKSHSIRRFTFDENNSLMKKKKSTLKLPEEPIEIFQLKTRITQLEEQVKDAEMKALAFSTMVDIAEKELKISIRKKLNTKPLKK